MVHSDATYVRRALFGYAIVGLAIGVAVYPERRVLTWFELFTDGLAPDSLASSAQDVLAEMWTDAFQREGAVDPDGRVQRTLRELMANSSESSVVELAAGGGAAAAEWNARLRHGGVDATVLLTDLQPNVRAWRRLRERHGEAIGFVEAPTDATALALSGRAPRMIHVALHHFPPHLVRAVLADVLRAGASIVVADLAPTAGGLLWNAVLSNKYALRPAKLRELGAKLRDGELPWWVALLLPITPLLASHDATVSVLRAYSAAQLRALAADAARDVSLEQRADVEFETRVLRSGAYADWLGLPTARGAAPLLRRVYAWAGLSAPVVQYFVLAAASD